MLLFLVRSLHMDRIDTKSGFCPDSKIFHSLRPSVNLPPETTPLSAAAYALSLHSSSPFPDSTAAIINSATGSTLSYSHFIQLINSLSQSLQSLHHLSKNDVAYILSPNSPHLPILFFSLLQIGVIVSPANPLSTPSEISRQIQLSKPVIAFATSATTHKIPKLKYGTLLIESMMKTRPSCSSCEQSDVAANPLSTRSTICHVSNPTITFATSATKHNITKLESMKTRPSCESSPMELNQSDVATNHVSNTVTAFATSSTAHEIPRLQSTMKTRPVEMNQSDVAANRLSTRSKICHISNPIISATSATEHEIPELESTLKTRPGCSSCEWTPVEVYQSDVAAIMYSSGTTGEGKGVTITHRNLIAAICYNCSFREERCFPRVVLHALPYFHIFGFSYCFRSIAMKETVVVMEKYVLKEMLRAVETYKVNFVPVVPAIVVAMVKEAVVDDYDLRSLEMVSSGGAPLGKDVIINFGKKCPNVLLAQGYSLTETTGVAFRALTPEEIRRWGSVGKMFSTFEAKIVDPTTGASLPPCRRGELWLRSPSIMKGYVDNAKATSDTLVSDGWLRTGDICYFDEEGHLFVVDRLKELIKYKGFQVPPAELEELLLSHPQIIDAAVIPYPDEEAGEVPMAFVVRHSQSSLDKSEVMDFVSKQVSSFKKVRRVRFVTSIPKSPAGKILRKELRKIAILESKI